MSDWTEPRRYPSDDPDTDPCDLVVSMGGNGDWYLSILRPGERIGPTVRLTTSGAPSRFHGATNAVARLYMALGGEGIPACVDCEARGAMDLLEDELGS